jgi:hypothetical protein
MNLATQQRDAVAAKAAANTQEALELARTIADPWFRCQALSMVAVHIPDRRRQQLVIQEAFASATELSEPNRIVTVSSWPLKVLLVTGNKTKASAETERLLRMISAEGSPVRRADALRQLLGSVSTSRDLVQRVSKEFAAACLAPLQSGKRNKKGESHLEECLPAMAQVDPEFAETILTRLTPDRSARAARAMAAMKNVPLSRILPWPHFEAK